MTKILVFTFMGDGLTLEGTPVGPSGPSPNALDAINEVLELEMKDGWALAAVTMPPGQPLVRWYHMIQCRSIRCKN